MIIFTFPIWMILVLILGAAGIIYGIIQNIVTIILVSVAVIIVFCLFMRWPGKTFVGMICVFVLSTAFLCISSKVKTNQTPVYIYRATNTCAFFDEKDSTIQIPSGAIVAKFLHPKQESGEQQYSGHSHMCYWYYDGEVFSSTVSVMHGSSLAEKMHIEENIWNLEEIREITYKQFLKNDWWS